MDPDQMASSEAISSGSTLYSVEFISGFILLLIEFIHVYCLSTLSAKLRSILGDK